MKNEGDFDLIGYRLEQARVALDDARFLIEGNRSAQSIANRSYYAMFYAVLALLQKIGKVPSKHSGAISLFDTEFALKDLLPQELSKDLHKAFELRQISDYKIIDPLTPEKAKEVWGKAVHFVEAVEKYLLGPENREG